MNSGGIFDLDNKKKIYDSLQIEMSAADFWNNKEKADKTVKKVSSLKSDIEPIEILNIKLQDVEEMIEILLQEETLEDNDLLDLDKDLGNIEKSLNKLEFKTKMSDPDDKNNAILSINAGAGGTESCDWASMLVRMFRMWSEKNNFEVQVFDALPGEEAGIKNTTFIIKGNYAFGYLRSERGVHRLVRISPFDSNKRRHTSFVSVDVIPEVSDEIDIEIIETDLRIDTYRSSGAGGQHVNVTDSAVRITHLPTNIVAQCQNDRSQHKNKAAAMKVLKAKLYEHENQKKKKELQQKYGNKDEIAWGSQIRSYVFQPYTMVKDHRTEHKTSNVGAVMDGEITEFMEMFLAWKAEQKIEKKK
ncbi:MAG: peptide chain release factor 2 [Candidatus Aureabacteria bacterium]|nr:peptide chain release factor 2 [Candidatus Auribacterota bacterium]